MSEPSDEDLARAYALVQADLEAIGPWIDLHIRRGRVIVDASDIAEGRTLKEAIDKLKRAT